MQKLLPFIAATLCVFSQAKAQTYTLNATAYNALASQTDSTPNITATGTRARVGIVALSRDMLRVFPYGSRVKVVSQHGCGLNVVGRTFRVEDTMAARKTRTVDIFMNTRSQALAFGRCSVTLRRI